MSTSAFSSRTRTILALAMLTAPAWFACTESSSISLDDGQCQCAQNQVCAKNGICYDDKACEACTENEVCVGGACYASNGPCGKCKPNQFCVNNACSDTQNGNGNGENGNGENGGNGNGENGGNGNGENGGNGNGENGNGNGENGGNDPKTCDSGCPLGSQCVDGNCEECAVFCGGACCNDNQVCDKITGACADPCEDGQAPCYDECCFQGQFCEEVLGCVYSCDSNETACPNYAANVMNCCATGKLCQSGLCIDDCGDNVRCNNVCCKDGEVCEANQCKIACENGTRCGDDEEYCCDNETQLCLFGQCHERGKTCETSNNCSFDEYCDEATMSCVNTDILPSTCQVIPEFDEFSAHLQWYWPYDLPGHAPSTYSKYIRVIVMPMAANLTDDNNDGVIDENDVPDVVFIAYSTDVGPDTQAPSVIRVISGDNGHEIASSTPRYWTYPLGAAIADVDNDGKPDIIAGTNHHRSGYIVNDHDYIDVMSVDPDPASSTGYSIHINYKLQITDTRKISFINVADLDADGIPEIITNYGVASVVKAEDGTKSLQWRKGCEEKDRGWLHAANLDNEGPMELISSTTIYDDHCNVLVSGLPGGNIAIADLMPSSANANTTGELIPEIAHAISGYKGGSFQFWKIFKKVNDDETVTWSVEQRWTAPIPVDEKRDNYIKNCLSGAYTWHCNSGAGTPVIADFNGDTIPDVGVASRYYYIVYSNDGTPEGGKVLWADSKTVDYSSAVTGSSVFDFEGDGKAEVVYGDEKTLHIYTGEGSGVDKDGDGYPDPVHLFSTPNYSATGYEYPIIVDVDNDGSTEIVIASDMSKDVTMGVRAFEDPGGQWVRTRRIWNQHHYHVTNINENGSVPVHEEVNWLHPKLNNYRQNVQPGGVYNAPDLVAKNLSEDSSACTATEKHIKLTADVANDGSLSVKAGVVVRFYAQNINDTDKTVLIGEKPVAKVLQPGSSASVTLDWNGKAIVDGVETDIKTPVSIYYIVDEPTTIKQRGEFVECIEDNNTSDAKRIAGCDEIIY